MTSRRLLQAVLFAGLVTLGWCNRADAGSGVTTVSSNTVTKVLAEARGGTYTEWTTNTAYAQGQMVTAPKGGLNYMCVVAGTSTNNASLAPRGLADYTEGTCTWRVALNKSRKILVLSNSGSGVCYITTESTSAGLRKGIRLNANGGTIVLTLADDPPQDAIYCFAEGDTYLSHFER